MDKAASNHVVKIGIVVHDIEEVTARYAKLFDLDPPPVAHVANLSAPKKPKKEGTYRLYKGKEYSAPLNVAIINLEPVFLELLEPADDTPSPWKDHLDKFGNSVCFISFYIHGFRQQIDMMGQQGYPLIFEEEKGHERYAYFDTLEKLGVMIEFKERDEDKA